MPGREKAPASGRELERTVEELARRLGLEVRRQVSAGRRIWGKRREIDLVVRHPETKRVLGIECKAQSTPGTAEEKIIATVRDIEHWPIPGIVVVSGEGFSQEILGYLMSTGRAVHLDDLEEWLRLYFGID
jgi:acyl-CoA synthetase (NDP forming)